MSIPGLLIATFIGTIIGILWYSKGLFEKTWSHESHIPLPGFKKDKAVYLYTLLNTFLLAVVLAQFLRAFTTEPSIFQGMLIGGMSGLGMITPAIATTFLIEGRTMKHLLITAFYHTATMILMGGLIAYFS